MIAYMSWRARAWSSLRLITAEGPPVQGPGLGFVAIFATREEAMEGDPHAEPIQVEVAPSWFDSANTVSKTVLK